MSKETEKDTELEKEENTSAESEEVKEAADTAENATDNLNRYTSDEISEYDNSRARARPSPPLLPIPQNILIFFALTMSCTISHDFRALATRSIKSTDATGSCTTVYLSHSFIAGISSIFITIFYANITKYLLLHLKNDKILSEKTLHHF